MILSDGNEIFKIVNRYILTWINPIWCRKRTVFLSSEANKMENEEKTSRISYSKAFFSISRERKHEFFILYHQFNFIILKWLLRNCLKNKLQCSKQYPDANKVLRFITLQKYYLMKVSLGKLCAISDESEFSSTWWIHK